jgi:hypothetical protein
MADKLFVKLIPVFKFHREYPFGGVEISIGKSYAFPSLSNN